LALLQEVGDVKLEKDDHVTRQNNASRKEEARPNKKHECRVFLWVTKLVPLVEDFWYRK
jgi:hypothetical protein